jgi:hypothetical protein
MLRLPGFRLMLITVAFSSTAASASIAPDTISPQVLTAQAPSASERVPVLADGRRHLAERADRRVLLASHRHPRHRHYGRHPAQCGPQYGPPHGRHPHGFHGPRYRHSYRPLPGGYRRLPYSYPWYSRANLYGHGPGVSVGGRGVQVYVGF